MDEVVETGGIKLLMIDPESLAVPDRHRDGLRRRSSSRVSSSDNPSEKGRCGCGESFRSEVVHHGHFARLGLPAAALDLVGALDKAYFAGQPQMASRSLRRQNRTEERSQLPSRRLRSTKAYRTLEGSVESRCILPPSGCQLPGDGKTIDDRNCSLRAMEARELHDAHCSESVELTIRAPGRYRECTCQTGWFVLGKRDKPAIRKTLLRLRYLDKFIEEARARRINLERKA